MSAGTDIAAEVLAGLQEAGTATGDGPLYCTLRRVTGEPTTPWGTGAGTVTYHQVTAVDTETRARDASGTLIGTVMRTLLVDATGEAPLKSDRIAVGYTPDGVTASEDWAGWMLIEDVITVAPGGVPLMFEVRLAR